MHFPETMRVVSLLSLDESLRLDGRQDPVVQVCREDESPQAIYSLRPNVLISGPKQLSPELIEAFAGAGPSNWSRILSADPRAHGRIANGARFLPVSSEAPPAAMLRTVERDFTRSVTFARAGGLIAAAGRRPSESRVLVIGAGIVNLMTALRLREEGWGVTVVEASAAPQRTDWSRYGCTHGGEDARMFSITEFDNYNEKGDKLYTDMADVFERPLSAGGWLALPRGHRSAEELAWNDMFRRVPAWLAQGFAEEIYECGRDAMLAWDRVFAALPALRESGGYREGLVRTYDDPVKLETSRALQSALGTLERVLTPAELAARHPLFGAACDTGAICGALEIRGFTVQIHALVAQLVALLEDKGVEFRWGARAERFVRADDGTVLGAEVGGQMLEANHYVVSPGIYGGGLLDGFQSRSLLHGVLGAWTTLPHVGGGLSRSVKLKRSAELNEDVNVTVATRRDGQPILILGSGYGYVGRQPDRLCPAELQRMYDQLDQIAARFFPDAYRAARDSGMLAAGKRYCIRPWTPTGLGVFEVQPARDGMVIVTGGHNTGGFAVSPVVADAVSAALAGEVVDMHWRFHPRRLSAALPALHHLVH
jgi:D-amino-acid dehydrogenase